MLRAPRSRGNFATAVADRPAKQIPAMVRTSFEVTQGPVMNETNTKTPGKRGAAGWPPAASEPAGGATPPCAAWDGKFDDPRVTLKGEPRAIVPFSRFETLWLNTGTLCNIACHNCYIESSPSNDRLAYLSRAEAQEFIAEAAGLAQPPTEIGFTGGEPFMNPDIIGLLEDALAAGFRVLVLTNAMRPMHKLEAPLASLNERFPGRLAVRVSLDHYEAARHEAIRGKRTWSPTLAGLGWLAARKFDLAVASRTLWGETAASLRSGFARLFAAEHIPIDAHDPARLVLFPEMDDHAEVPEITEHCWGILGKAPSSVMCATSRMVVKRKGAHRPAVVSCTLLPYDAAFEMGATLSEAMRPVPLNHPHCARFCVLGGGSCSVKVSR